MTIVREPMRVVASVFSLCGFVVAIVVGWRAGASTGQILLNAILALAACKGVGLLVGWLGESAIKDFLVNYKADHPVPAVKAAERALLRSGAGVEESLKKSAA